MLRADWIRDHVTSVGPLGRLYRTWGDGRRMVDGDIMDFFHLTGYSANELRDMGFHVWTDLQPPGEWISEGDTTNMLNLFANGLRGHEHPGYGGWGGRAAPTSDGLNEWSFKRAETPHGAKSQAAAASEAGNVTFSSNNSWSCRQ